jgi:poly-gamma-glutamate capsule biosynthesis protein CapA/YwtB (metallophosphatase superfamily)
MRKVLLISLVFYHGILFSQVASDSDKKLTLLFIGDMMGHEAQIKSAYDSASNKFNYDSCYKYIKNEISEADLAIANLEVTLAGRPYTSYPQFSSPDEFAIAGKNAGIDYMVTANNHCCDRGAKGILRTLNMLDSLGIKHTGTFRDSADRDSNNILILEKNGIKIALLNYTYGTNGIAIPFPTMVNVIDRKQISHDVESAKKNNPDFIILFVHWGDEYKSDPNEAQMSLANYCFSIGIDIIIGSHPHVIERMERRKDTISGKDQLVVYSMGNFISNMKKQRTDGGAMVNLMLEKSETKTSIVEVGYRLIWIYTPIEDGKKKFYIIPCARYENEPYFFQSSDYYNTMKIFINDSRKLFTNENIGVTEIR